jgi:hypothetical protein
MSRSNITMARSTVLVGFNAPTAFCDVDFRVMFLIVDLKVGSSVNSISESAFESVFDLMIDLGINEVVGINVLQLVVASSTSLKVTFRLVRTIFLTGFYSLKMVIALYPTS